MTLDASDYINKSKLTATETRRLVRQIEDARTPAEKYARELDRLSTAYNKGAIEASTYGRLTEQAKAKMESAAAASAKLSAQTDKSSTAFTTINSKLAGIAATYVSMQTAMKSVRMAADAEMAAASFEVLTGSIEGSRYILGELRDLAAKTPLTFTGVQDAAKLMMAFNVPAKEVMGNLEMLSDISMGNQQRFDMLALAFSQASAAGRLMGQDLLQMVNAGFNPLQEISKRTGESLTDLRKRMEAGKIPIDEVKQAFADATSEGGKFNGMSDRIAETMGGKLAIAASNLEQVYISLGKAMSGLVIGATSGMDTGISFADKMIAALRVISDGWGYVFAITSDIVDNVKNLMSGDFAKLGEGTAIFLYEDFIKRRNEEEEAAKNSLATQDALNSSIQNGTGAMAGMAGATASLGESYDDILSKLELQTLELMHGKEMVERIKMLESGLTAEQADRILGIQKMNDELEKQKKLEEKITEEKKRQQEAANEDFASSMADAFEANIDAALSAARNHFQNEERRWEQMRKASQQSPQGMEVGSDSAASYLANLANQRIGAAAMPDRPTVGDEEIVEEAKKQLQAIQQTNERMDRQYAIFREMLAEQKNNGFARIR